MAREHGFLHALSRTAVPVFICCTMLAPATVSAQVPRAGVRLIVPFAAAGPIDLTARVLAEALRPQLGVPVIVENRTGANGTVAALAVKQSAPDGSMLLVATSGLMTISPHIEKNLPFDPATDFVPVAPVTYIDSALVIGAHVPAKNLKEFLELARTANPPLALGSAGIGNVTHGYIELLKDVAKVNLLHVPYQGIAAAFKDVIGGQIAGTWPAFNLALPQIKAGKVILLGVVGNKRSAIAPEFPTLAEQGYPGVDFLTWTALLGPQNTPREVVKQIGNGVTQALASSEARAKLFAAGITPWSISVDEFRKVVSDESSRWKKLIQEKNIFGK